MKQSVENASGKRRLRLWGRQQRTGMLLPALSVLSALFLTACGHAPEQPEPEKITLELWYYWDGSTTRHRLLTLIDEFNASHEDVQVEAQYVPDEDFKKKLALAMADGEAPDLAIVDSSDVQYYNHMNPLVEVSDYIDEAEYLDEALASCRGKNGEVLGLPLGINCLAFYYNEDILREQNIALPQNMDEFVDAAKQATVENVYGCAFPSLQSEESVFCFLPLLWSEGGSLSDINSDAGRQAFDVLRKLAKEHGMSHRTVNMTLSDISKEFSKGNIAMMFSTSGRERQILKANPNMHFSVAPLPTGEDSVTVIGGEVLTILCGDHRQESVEFVQFLADSERIKSYLDDFMYLAPRKDILEWQTKEHPEQEKYVEYLKSGRTRDFTPYWPSVSMAVADVINQVILEEDQANALERLEQEIKTIREAYDE